MASIRRAQSPYHNGGATPFSVQSPSQKHLLAASSSPSPISKLLRRLLFFTTPTRKPHHSWKKSLYRCILFFLLGLLLGIANFNFSTDSDETPFNHQSFENTQNTQNNQNNQNNRNNRDNRDNDQVEISRIEDVRLFARGGGEGEGERKEVIVVTATYNRGMQSYYLNRMGQVLRLVRPPLLWIVVEMSVESLETAEVLRKTGVMYRHLVCGGNLTDEKDRGVRQRNRALEHIELHRLDGIVYFADDDNVYSVELFESLRNISRFGTWPVAMLAQSKNKAVLEGPVCSGSQVVGWHTNEKSKRLRRFHVDMSGFAFNSTILWDPKRWKRPNSNPVRQLDSVKEGFQETTFIEQVVEDEQQMEGIPHGCSKIMNWHLHLDSRELNYPKGWVLQKNLDVVLPVK